MSAVARHSSKLHFDDRSAIVAGAVMAVTALGMVAVYSPKLAVEALIGVGLVALALWRLPIATAVFVVLTFPEYLPGSLGAGPTVAKPLGIILVLAWAATVAVRRGATRLLIRDHPALFWATLAFVLLAAASAIWAPDFGLARYQLSRLVLAAVFLLVVYTAASTASGFRLIIWAYLLGSTLVSAYGIATGGYGNNGRLSALFDPNYFAGELIPAIVIAGFLVLTTTSRRTRIAAAIVLAIDIPAFVLTQSRGGIVGITIGLMAAVILAARARARVVVAVLLLIALGGGYYLVYEPSHLRGSFSGSFATASSGRSDEWKLALRMFANHPVNGVGLGNFVAVEPSYATQSINLNFVRFVVTDPLVAHNSYLEIAAELGVAGIALFVTILTLATVRARGALRSLAGRLDSIEFYARGLIAGAIGMFGAFFFLSAEYQKQLWLVLGLLAAVVPVLTRGDEGSLATRQTR